MNAIVLCSICKKKIHAHSEKGNKGAWLADEHGDGKSQVCPGSNQEGQLIERSAAIS